MAQNKAVTSRYFLPWRARENISLAFATYQAGKIFLIGSGGAEPGSPGRGNRRPRMTRV